MEQTMIYLLLADFAVVAHALFVLFVIGGGLAVLRWPWLAWLHLPAAVWGGVIEIAGWICPLTHLENRFRRLGGQTGYAGSFIAQYLEPILYPAGLTVRAQVLMGLGVLVLNAALYVRLWRHHHPRRG
jgi:hypothetical protein